MIYFFSGTGNSRFAAHQLGCAIADSTRFIPDLNPYREKLPLDGENPEGASATRLTGVGFVFPVYSWGVPPIVLDFISKLPQAWVEGVREAHLPIWCVATCGDETGNAVEMLRSALRKRGLQLAGAWSVIMPNVYVLLPGFGVDSEALAKRKMEAAAERIAGIGRRINAREWEVDVHTGSVPALRSLAFPLFRRWGVDTRKWHSTDACTGCGACARACPAGNIAMVGRRPQWGTDCLSCCACFHVCPEGSVQYGRITRRMGQYKFKKP